MLVSPRRFQKNPSVPSEGFFLQLVPLTVQVALVSLVKGSGGVYAEGAIAERSEAA